MTDRQREDAMSNAAEATGNSIPRIYWIHYNVYRSILYCSEYDEVIIGII